MSTEDGELFDTMVRKYTYKRVQGRSRTHTRLQIQSPERSAIRLTGIQVTENNKMSFSVLKWLDSWPIRPHGDLKK